MSAVLGEVAQIWRYPIKSLGGERLVRALVSEDGLTGDRDWALWDETRNELVTGKRHPDLMQLQGCFVDPDDPLGPIRIVAPDGEIFRLDDPWATARLSARIGLSLGFRRRPPSGTGADRAVFRDSRRRVHEPLGDDGTGARAIPVFPGDMDRLYQLYLTTPGLFADCSPLHLITTDMLTQLGGLGGDDVADVRRYRPNLVLDLGRTEPSLVGMRMAVGGTVLEILCGTPRCSMPSQAQNGLAMNWSGGAAIAAMPGANVGVYADVVEIGEIREGDPVRAVPEIHPVSIHPRYMMQPADAALLATRAQRESGQRAQGPAFPEDLIAMRVVSVRRETAEVTTFEFEAADGRPLPRFLPGQHIRLAVENAGYTVSRSYTLSSSPLDSSYAISVKREPAGRMSPLLHDSVSPGSIVHASSPRGVFHIDPASDGSLLFATMGIGITPMISALRTLSRTQPERVVKAIHGARRQSDVPFLAEIEEVARKCPNFSLTLMLSGEEPGPGGRTKGIALRGGRIDAEVLDSLSVQDLSQGLICGTPSFNKAVADRLEVLAPEMRATFELFGAPAVSDQITSRPAQVRFARSGREVAWTGQERSLLDLAEHHGIAAASDCRAGICKSCKYGLITGEVSYFAESLRPIDRKSVLLCCAKPATARLTLDL